MSERPDDKQMADYLAGELAAEDKPKLVEAMAKDPALQEELRDQKAIDSDLRSLSAMEHPMNDQKADRPVGEIEKRLPSGKKRPKPKARKPSPRRRRKTYGEPEPSQTFTWIAMAAVAAIAVVGLCTWHLNRAPDPRRRQVALIKRCAPHVFANRSERNIPLATGSPVIDGDVIHASKGEATIQYGDGTIVQLHEGAEAGFDNDRGAKYVRLHHGDLSSTITQQSPRHPMVFATPQGRATVVGTALTLAVGVVRTRLDVMEGRVRFARTRGRSVLVKAGQRIDTTDMKIWEIVAAAKGKTWNAYPIIADLRGWKVIGGDWHAANGELIGTSKDPDHDGRPQIVSQTEFGDFEMQCEMRSDEQRISKIQLRNNTWQFSNEVGDLLGVWRKVRVVAEGSDVRCWIDGKAVKPELDGTESDVTKGSIGFHATHKSVFRIRNIRIRNLD